MRIDEITTHSVLAALFPQLDEKDIQIMVDQAEQDFEGAIGNLKDVIKGVAGQLEATASKLHNHPATSNDAVLESAVGDLNTMAGQLKTAAGDEASAEVGSVLDTSDPSQATQVPAGTDPASVSPPASSPDSGSSGASSPDTSGSAAAAPASGSEPAASDSPLPVSEPAPAPTDGTGASSAGGDAGAPASTPAS